MRQVCHTCTCLLGRSVFESLFQIILIGVLSLSLGSIEMMGILFFWIQWGFGSPASQSLFTIWNSFQAKEKNQNGYISLTLARNEKIRPLYFIQLLKFDKINCSYFFDLSSFRWDMAIFCFLFLNLALLKLKNEKMAISRLIGVEMKKYDHSILSNF